MIDLFLDNLPLVLDADGDGKRIRDVILQLAVRGRLVRQEEGDATRPQGSSAKQDPSAPLPFGIPPRWTIGLLQDVATSRLGKMLDKTKNRGQQVPYLRNTNIHWFEVRLDDLKQTRIEPREFDEYRVQAGDVLVCEGGHGIGRAAVWTGGLDYVAFQKALHRIRPHSGNSGRFIAYCIAVYHESGFLSTFYTGSGIPHLTGRSLAMIPFPLPPLPEQHRIVAKVDELMGHAAVLEERHLAASSARVRLRDAALHALAEAEDAAAVETAWRRIEEHFEDLFTEPEDVAPLRQAVLQLAVRGRLVGQDAANTAALVQQAIHQVHAVQRELISQGKLAKPRAIDSPLNALPSPLPHGWAAVPLAAALEFDLTDGDWVESVDNYPDGDVRLVQLADVGIGEFRDRSDRHLTSAKAAELRCTYLLPNDVLIARLPDPLGRACLFPGSYKPCVTVVDVAIARTSGSAIAAGYLVLCMNSPMLQQIVVGHATGTTRQRVSTGNLRRTCIPLPPIVEQHRIVAKVDELMALCDTLEASLTRAKAAREQFAASISAALDADPTQSPDRDAA